MTQMLCGETLLAATCSLHVGKDDATRSPGHQAYAAHRAEIIVSNLNIYVINQNVCFLSGKETEQGLCKCKDNYACRCFLTEKRYAKATDQIQCSICLTTSSKGLRNTASRMKYVISYGHILPSHKNVRLTGLCDLY